MNSLTCAETYIDKNKNHYGCFIIEPLEIGQGITLGNAIRRTILSELFTYAITSVRINNLKHEFSSPKGLREDVIELLLNIKQIKFKHSFIQQNVKTFSKLKGFIVAKGPCVITAGMIQLPKKYLLILNPELYIGTISDNSEFYMEIDIEAGKGYKLNEDNRKKNFERKIFSQNSPYTLFLDALFLPIKKINYKVKLIHDTQGNIKESLSIEILTNGSITPKRCIIESIKNLLNLFSSLFSNSNFLNVSKN